MSSIARPATNVAVSVFFGWLLWRVTHRWELWVAGYLVFVHLVQLLQAIESLSALGFGIEHREKTQKRSQLSAPPHPRDLRVN